MPEPRREPVGRRGGNEVRDNVVAGSGRADLALGRAGGRRRLLQRERGPRRARRPRSSSCAAAARSARGCGGGDPAPTVNLGTRFLDALDGAFPHGDWRSQPAPPDQPRWRTRRRRRRDPARSRRRACRSRTVSVRVGQIDGRATHRREGDDRVRNPARHVVVEPADRPLRLRAARLPVRGVGHDRAVGSDPPGVRADLVPRAVDGGRDPGAVPRAAPLLRVRDARRSRSSCG